MALIIEQQELFEPAVEAVSIGAFWMWPDGWQLNVVARRSGQSWARGRKETYDGLSTNELLDVLTLELAVIFGLTEP